MEFAALVAEALLACRQSSEVFSSLGHIVTVQTKNDATDILAVEVDVKENFVWFVLLLRRCVPPQLSCSNDGRVHHSRDPLSRLSFAASDLLPRRRQPRQLHYHHQLSR